MSIICTNSIIEQIQQRITLFYTEQNRLNDRLYHQKVQKAHHIRNPDNNIYQQDTFLELFPLPLKGVP